MEVKALHNKVVLRQIEKEPVTTSGIILSGGTDGSSTEGLVIGTGPEVNEVRVGDKVLANWSKANHIAGTDAYIITEDNIIAVVEE